MSDFAASNDPDHICGDACLPYVPLYDRDLEDLEESKHIDALYDVLNLAREYAALLVLTLARAGDSFPIRFPARAVAILLDLSEGELEDDLGHGQCYSAEAVVAYAIDAQGEDGYVGKALSAMFRVELEDLDDEE